VSALGPRPGIDALLAEPARWLPGSRVGLLTNQAAVTGDLRPTLEALGAADVRLARLFAFEHGLSGFEEDARGLPDARDPRSGLPVVSLYGPRRRPEPASLLDLDAVIVDVQEVGVRCYTYATTAALLLEAAAEAGVPVVVCDRPSLLGPRVAGPALEPRHRSFLGYLDVPFQHGLTIGEGLHRYAARALGGRADLRVVPVAGWRRDDPPPSRPFVPPSPGLPSLDAVTLYPGLVLAEGTNLSEGRGTPLPFALLAAPWLDPYALADEVAGLELPGLWPRPLNVEPDAGPFAGRRCGGVQLHVTEPGAVRAFEAGVRILARLRARRPELRWVDAAEMPWSVPGGAGGPWHEPTRGPLLDGLTGSEEVRDVLDGRRSIEAALDGWRRQGEAFARDAEPHLLYPPSPRPS
jgi:uncharacterized protein YbbC (DUF1343 family)